MDDMPKTDDDQAMPAAPAEDAATTDAPATDAPATEEGAEEPKDETTEAAA